MSDGSEKDRDWEAEMLVAELPFNPKDITVHEFLRLWKSIHMILKKRVEAAKKKSDKFPGDTCAFERYVESIKELYAFIRLMSVAGTLGREVSILKDLVTMMESEKSNPFTMPIGDDKKNKPN